MGLAACGDEPPPRPSSTTPTIAVTATADLAVGMTTELDGATPGFADAVLAELTGDDVTARAGFERVLGAPEVPSPIAARAALHLAQIEARAGRRRYALDYVVRAAALAPTDIAIAEGVAQLQAEDVTAKAGDIRGPRIGTTLPGVDAKVAEAFAIAERALERVHDLRPRPVIEALSSSVRVKEDATEDVASKYRALGASGGLAAIAAAYRIGSLYHDLALGLLFELPPELDPAVAAGLRRTLRGRAVAYLRKAVTAYRDCLEQPQQQDAELWRLAAETDVRGAEALLGAAGDR
ncbi:MAG: hypothetical protein NT062_15320 [Proteobacteria bacterium]|nr:hypothetical protein [Pseudomonadota bacterium]